MDHSVIHPSLDQFHSLSQMASGTNRPFCHNTLSGPTFSQTHRWSRRQARTMSAPLARYADRERRAKNDRWAFSNGVVAVT